MTQITTRKLEVCSHGSVQPIDNFSNLNEPLFYSFPLLPSELEIPGSRAQECRGSAIVCFFLCDGGQNHMESSSS